MGGNLRKGDREGRPVLFTTPEIKLRGLIRSKKELRAGWINQGKLRANVNFILYAHYGRICGNCGVTSLILYLGTGWR